MIDEDKVFVYIHIMFVMTQPLAWSLAGPEADKYLGGPLWR